MAKGKVKIEMKEAEPEVKVVHADHEAVRYTVSQILTSKRYAERRDALGAILDARKTYTLPEVEKLLDEFMKGKVK